MNDNILRGFCQKCEWPIRMDWVSPTQCFPQHYAPDAPEDYGYGEGFTHKVEPVWFLSAQQMKIIIKSWEFRKWLGEINGLHEVSALAVLITKLKDNPFLVSKILKDAGEKSKEGNK